ncbi:MAG: hypothetical protein IT488_10695 [Gammaproteobacteria bacterium]|nr:hypothetical protein [Gammaproteobacteria bacterium]
MSLLVPLGVFAAEAGQLRGQASMEAGFNAAEQPIQLAAAIGIVKPEASEPAVSPTAPPAATPPAPPVEQAQAQTVEPAAEEEEAGASRTVSGKQIMIGVGVAALLGALGGGGSSSGH